jgi:peptidyl-tRNA hydrolase ICT1
LHQGIRESRFYAANSDAITIQCDAQRGRAQNKDETHEKLFGEIEKIYKDTVPGITTVETKKKIESL